MNPRALLIFLFLFSSSVSRGALTATETFSSNTNKDSGNTDMVWNIQSGELHPPLLVVGFDRGGGAEDYAFEVGNGSNGDFVDEADYRALSCATVSGNVISINTSSCSELQFTRFHLQTGWTIRPTGSNPLVIRSLSTVIVDGSIDCSGDDGESGTSTYTSIRQGGVGRCGGGDGGDSVLPNTAAGISNRGGAGGSLVTGGDGGGIQDVNGGQGGGGGGAYVKDFSGAPDSPDGTDGKDASGVDVGNVGTNYASDAAFIDDEDGAGSGGGGGSGFQSGADPGNSSGGAGGGGGGNVRIYAVGDVTVNGSILADGGDGGTVVAPLKAGAGGGGGGGSILIMTVGDIVNEGTISATNGSGGSANSNADGGDGYWGRTWVVEKDGFAGGTNIESPETTLNSPGDVRYETGVNYTVISKAIDLGNSQPELLSALASVEDQGAATLTFEVAFGDSPTDSSLSSFALPATYAGSKVGRYGKFRVQIDNQDATTPARVTMVNFSFDGFTQQEFDFVGACGRVGTGPQNLNPLIIIILYLLPILILVRLNVSK